MEPHGTWEQNKIKINVSEVDSIGCEVDLVYSGDQFEIVVTNIWLHG
jgi:hypothetical protein